MSSIIYNPFSGQFDFTGSSGGGGGGNIDSINGDSTPAQTLTVGTTGTDFAIVDNGTGDHKFNLPTASAVNRGALSSVDWTTFNNKQPAGNYITALTGEVTATGPGSVAATISALAVTVGKLGSGAATSIQPLFANGIGGASYRSIVSGDLPSLSGLYANTTLSNLTSVTSINEDLLPATDGTGPNLGSATKRWQDIFVLFATDNVGGTTVNFRDRQLTDNNTDTISLDWQNRNLYDTTGNLQASWSNVGLTLDTALVLNGATSGSLTQLAASSTTSYSVTWPSAQGASSTVLTNNGSGVLSWVAATAVVINNKELFVLSGTDITNQYVDLANVALTNSIHFVVKGSGSLIEGASYDYSVNYTGGAGGNTRITFLNDLATGGGAALIAGDVVVVQYEF